MKNRLYLSSKSYYTPYKTKNKMEKMLKVTPVRHMDVRKREVLYLVIEDENEEQIIINVGEKTLKKVEELIKSKHEIRTQTEMDK